MSRTRDRTAPAAETTELSSVGGERLTEERWSQLMEPNDRETTTEGAEREGEQRPKEPNHQETTTEGVEPPEEQRRRCSRQLQIPGDPRTDGDCEVSYNQIPTEAEEGHLNEEKLDPDYQHLRPTRETSLEQNTLHWRCWYQQQLGLEPASNSLSSGLYGHERLHQTTESSSTCRFLCYLSFHFCC